MKRLLRRLVAISFTLVVATSSAQRLAPFVAPTVTNVPPGGVAMRAERAAPLPEHTPAERTREAKIARENLLAASSNAVGLARSAKRINTVLGGGRADFGLLKVFFPADANGVERFRVTTPDGRELTFQPRFLAWHDTSTGERWLLAQVTNRVGLIMPSGQVLYTNAFDADVHADLRFRYSRNLLEQDVILRSRQALPEGAVADNLRLELWTETFDSTPAAQQTQMIDLRRGQDDGASALAADTQMDFISAKIGGGSAFSTGEPDDKFPVAKTWARVEGRDWLIETVDYPALKAKFDALGGSGRKRTAKASTSQEDLIRSLAIAPGAPASLPASSLIETEQRADKAVGVPSAESAAVERVSPSLLLAQADLPETRGVVVDFAILACVPVPPGIISWWPAGGNAKDAIAASGSNGTLHNTATYGPGKVGQSFIFSATGYVQMPNTSSLNPQSGLTVEAWVYFTSAASGLNKPIVSKDGGSGRQYLLTKTGDNVIRAHVGIAGDTFRFTDGQIELEPNTWHHVALTYSADDSVLAIYVNGELDVAAQVSGSLLTSSEPLYLGGAPYWGYYWAGGIDEASVYDRALSEEEIQMIYEAGAAGKINPNCVAEPSDLAAWLPGDTHAYDVHTGNAATLQNGAGYAPAVASHGFMFDGVNDGVTMTDANAAALNFAAGQDFSVEVWLKADVHSPTYGVASVLGKRYSPNSYTALGWELFLINGQPGLQLADSSGPANYITPGNLRNTGWRHVVVTVDRDSTTGVRFYVDGVQLTQFNPTGKAGSLSSTAPLRIGVHPQPGLNCFYKGVIDEATVYRRVLDGTEVSSLFQAGSAGKCKADVDSDGMEDWWEMHNFGNLDRTGTADYDADGLTDLEEFQLRTDPTMVELIVNAYKSPCEDKVYVDVTNGPYNTKKVKGGSFDLFIYLNGTERTYYATLQPWGPTEELAPGQTRTFTFCTPDESVTDFDYRVIQSGGNASQKFRIAVREELARVFKNTTKIVNLSGGDPNSECEDWPPAPIFPPLSRPSCDAKFRIVGQPCGEWPAPPCFPAAPSPVGGSPLVDNFYKPSEPAENVDLSCPKKGFKNVYAIKQWHGRWGFDSLENDGRTEISGGSSGLCIASGVRNGAFLNQ